MQYPSGKIMLLSSTFIQETSALYTIKESFMPDTTYVANKEQTAKIILKYKQLS